MRCSAEIVVQTWTQLFHVLVLYSACFATKNSTINCPVLYLIWWNTRLWQLWPYSNCIHCPEMHSFTQAKITNANRLVLYHACVAAPNATTVNHVVMYWDCLRSWLNTCTLCSTVSCLFCSNKFNCKLFGCVPFLMDYQWQCGCDHILSAFTAHKCTILHQQKQQLPTSYYCTMSVFRRTNCNNCKPMWWCTEIVLRQLHLFCNLPLFWRN